MQHVPEIKSYSLPTAKKHSYNKNLQNWNLVSLYSMVKKFKNLHFSSDKWQLAEKDFDNFQKIFKIKLGIKLKTRVYHFVI